MTDAIYLECWSTIQRHADAYDYAMGRVDRETANRMIFDLQPQAGWFPLEVLEIDAVLEQATDPDYGVWQPFPEAADLAREAAEAVADSWENDNGASGMALDLMQAWAEERGIVLIPRAVPKCPFCESWSTDMASTMHWFAEHPCACGYGVPGYSRVMQGDRRSVTIPRGEEGA